MQNLPFTITTTPECSTLLILTACDETDWIVSEPEGGSRILNMAEVVGGAIGEISLHMWGMVESDGLAIDGWRRSPAAEERQRCISFSTEYAKVQELHSAFLAEKTLLFAERDTRKATQERIDEID
ncbi:UNVERIFIED_CONTAM: hypothetical protein HDU68_006755 [Siphonaria sp. JEL0065]|nr:hypothetical protein HDU68_006755 [Siphonaria sp. JEL0065]